MFESPTITKAVVFVVEVVVLVALFDDGGAEEVEESDVDIVVAVLVAP